MNNKTLLIVLGVAVVLLVLTLVFSGGNFTLSEGDDPALQLAQQQAQRSGAVAKPVAEAEPAETEPVADAEPAEVGEATAAEETAEAEDEASAEADGDAAEEPAADEEPPAAPDGEATEEAEEAEEAEAPVVADTTAAPAADEGEEAAADEPEIAVGEDESDLMAEEELPEDPIERFKQMDPRDIIEAKYKDLNSRLTEPWNEDNPDEYIPQTGRVDPLTRVSSAVPDDLKPPRSGESDQNEIQTYLVSAAASTVVELLSRELICHNVVQIGLIKVATFSQRGDPRTFSIPEGQGTNMQVVSGGIGLNVTLQVTSISTSEVTVLITATGTGSSTRVSKTQVYIPSAFYH